MAHNVEPMDIDSDFDNKENSLHHNNVLPFTEKGYEELDVSELNMKLRYSVTPASSPMSKSYTANCLDNRSLESGDDSLNVTVNENVNLTRSLNSTMTKNDNVVKSLKVLPLQSLPTEQYTDSNRNTSVLRPLDSTATDNANITVTVNGPSDIDENLSLPSSSSSALQTPEATTPTKDPIPPKDGGSPIMRGLKSVLNMFRSSQSPIPPADNENTIKQEILSPVEETGFTQGTNTQVLASTPIAAHRKKEMSPTKRNSPQKDTSIVFNEDLEKELQWKDETTIIFSQERIPIHKLLFQQPQDIKNLNKSVSEALKEDIDNLNSTVEYMDISYNDSIRDRTVTEIKTDVKTANTTLAGDSDSEFVDCETTFSKNESHVEDIDTTPVGNQTQDLSGTKDSGKKNESGSRLKQIILDTTQDILDATLSVRPEDLLPEVDQTMDMSALVYDNTETIVTTQCKEILEKTSQIAQQPIFDQTMNVTNPLAIEIKNEDPNVTKTIEIMSTTQPILDQTVNITNPLALDGKNEDPNATKTLESMSPTQPILDQTVNITNPLAAKIEDLNATKTLEVLSTTLPILDQTVNISNPLELAAKTEDPNVTKTIEILTTTQISDQTVNITNPLALESKCEDQNEMQNIEVTSTTQPIFDQTMNITNPLALETKFDDPNATKTIEILSTTQPTDQTFDVTSSSNLEAQKENLDATKTIEANLDQTQTLQNEQNENCNVTVTGNNKVVDDLAIASNNINPNVPEPEPEPKEPEVIDNTNKVDIPEVAAQIPLEETPAAPLPEILDTVKEASMTELPVDIPLPDEDDIDKELDMPIEVTNEIIAPINQPLDLVDDIKITSEVSEKLIERNDDNKVPPELSAPVNTMFEGGDNMNNQTIENIFTEVSKVIDTELTLDNVKAELCNEIANFDVVPEVDAVVNIIDNENAIKTTDTNILENIINSHNTVPFEPNAIQSQEVIPMDINESVCELKPLPDIINQTITTSNVENLECNVSNPVVTEQVESKPEIVDNLNVLPVKGNDNTLENNINKLADELPPTTVTDTSVNEIITKDGTNCNMDVTMTEILPDLPLSKEVVPNEISVSTAENIITEKELKAVENIDTKAVDEEIIASENNSPFVSVIAEDIPEMKPVDNPEIENIEDPFATRTKVVVTPPSSPPIKSKGYNFNFDDLDFNPFATKTKIRLSPESESPNKPAEPKAQAKSIEKPVAKKDFNRRKSQPERKRPTAPKRKFNATFDGTTSDKIIEKPIDTPTVDVHLDALATVPLDPNNVTIVEKEDNEIEIPKKEETDENMPKEILKTETALVLEDNIEHPTESSTEISASSSNHTEPKATSSSEQSVYLSAGTSSSESIPVKNVFNLPEIDDINFNPFATKSKMRQSPPPSLDTDNPFATRSKVKGSPDSSMTVPKEDSKTVSFEDKVETEPMEKDASGNLSNTTVSSKATTVRTEDDDTIEGPFLEADDVSPSDKMSDFDGDNNDMMHFNELPPQTNDDNADNGELFIDAEAFEFLLNQNKCNTVVDSGKESLFLKFDPLFAKRMSAVTSDGVVASLAKLQKRQSTPTKSARTPPKNMPSPIAGPSNLNVTQDMDVSAEFNEDLNITVSKPMMVVPPAVNPVTPRNKSLTPNRSNRRSITFTSPAMAVIDRLLSLSGNNSLVHDTTVTQVSREQNEADIALSQLRELLAEKEISVYNLRSESNQLRDRLSSLENHVKNLESESQDRLKKINQLNDTLAEKTKINKSMAAVVEEYERTIASLIAETAQDKKRHAEERMKLINERDEQTAHLASMEVSFSDLHSKYEKSKQVILNCKANEDAYKKSIKEFEENLTKMQNNYELLKQHATSKLNHANQELEKMNRSHEAEVLKLNAMIKRKELHITSLEESLVQKTKANEELTAICDELINKVG